MHLAKRLEPSWEKEEMGGARRFEHPTSSSQNWRSTKLSYAPTKPRREPKINKDRCKSKVAFTLKRRCLNLFISFNYETLDSDFVVFALRYALGASKMAEISTLHSLISVGFCQF